MVTGLDRCQNRRAGVALVFKRDERFVVHLAIASKKIAHDRVDPAWRSSEEELEEMGLG